MKKKLELKDLSISSFVTSSENVKGGRRDTSDPTNGPSICLGGCASIAYCDSEAIC